MSLACSTRNDETQNVHDVQGAWKHIGFPHAFASSPRDPILFLRRYKMEEIANLLWVGHLLAKHGPEKFQLLWSALRPAATHYIYGLNAGRDACNTAADQMQVYATLLEQMVINKEV
jgi:hypothetical protein